MAFGGKPGCSACHASLAVATLMTLMLIATSASAQVVQLPSIRTFTYSGSVLVPDSGSAYLGGVRRSATSARQRGLNRSFGRAMGIGGAQVTATIIVLDAMDREIRGVDQNGKPHATKLVSQNAAPIDPTEEGKALVRFARSEYRKGNQSIAFDGYTMAIAALDGRLRQLAIDEFRRVFGAPADQALRSMSR